MGTFRPFGGKVYFLNGSISSTATSITLSSFAEPVSGTLYTMALLDTDIVYATISPKTSSSEFISFTGITQNADGTATLTGVTRGLAKKYPFTASATFRLPHSGQSQFIISNPPQLYNEYVTLDNAETIVGEKTFPAGGTANAPKSGTSYTAPTDSLEYASKQYVDNTATGTTNINRVIVGGTAGETIAVDQLVYLKVSDGRWWLCDADTAATVENVILGIAQGSGTAGNSINGGVLTYGLNTFSALTLTANTKYYASNTAGGFSSSAGTFEVSLGESQTTTTFLFNPRFDQQLTEDQQDALAGTEGTPSASNLFATATTTTKKISQTGAEIYAASSAGSDTYAVTLSPVPAAYVNGLVVRFKADVANTGAATLNVNGLGAISIVKGLSTALITGDIVANQIVEVVYNSTGPVFQMVSTPSTTVSFSGVFANGTTTKNSADASGAQNIAHGLGKIPKYVRIKMGGALNVITTPLFGVAESTYNGTTQSSQSGYRASGTFNYDSNFRLNLDTNANEWTEGVITTDATNIIITWTKTGSPTGTYQLLWEAEA